MDSHRAKPKIVFWVLFELWTFCAVCVFFFFVYVSLIYVNGENSTVMKLYFLYLKVTKCELVK